MRVQRIRPLAFLISLLLAYATLVALPGSASSQNELEPVASRAAATKPRLTAATPAPVAAGATARSKVTLLNTTQKNLAKVTITTKVSGSAHVTPGVKKIKKLRRGAKVAFGVKIVAGNERVAKVKVIAKVRGKKVATTRFRVRTKAGTSTPATSLTGRYFFHTGLFAEDTEHLYFGDGFVNRAVPDQAFLACASQSDTCQPYTYDPKSGALTVGGLTGQVKSTGGGLSLDNKFHGEAELVNPGARWAVSLSTSSVDKSCPYMPWCHWADYDLTFGADGSYREAVQTNIGFGTGEGNYEVISGSRVRLVYVNDGAVSQEKIGSIAVILDAAGNPDPVNGGLMLAGSWYAPAS